MTDPGFRIDPKRVVRAMHILISSNGADGKALPPFHYMCIDRTSNQLRIHYIQTRPDQSCTCEDFEIRLRGEEPCKHLIRGFLHEKDPLFLEAARKINLDVNKYLGE